MASIQNYLNQIKSAVFGKDVRQSIHDAIKQCYDDASIDHDNANMEVKLARGSHNTLNDRLDENEKNQENLSSQLDNKASKIELSVERERINNLAKLEVGSTSGDAELIDGRVGSSGYVSTSIGESIRNEIKPLNNEFVLLSNCIIDNRIVVGSTVGNLGLKGKVFNIPPNSVSANTTYVLSIVLDKNGVETKPVSATAWNFIDQNGNKIGNQAGFGSGITTGSDVTNYHAIIINYYSASGIEDSDIIKTLCLKQNGKADDIFNFKIKSNKIDEIDKRIFKTEKVLTSSDNIFNNLSEDILFDKTLTGNGNISDSPNNFVTHYIEINGNDTFYIGGGAGAYTCLYDEEFNRLGAVYYSYNSLNNEVTFDYTNVKYIRFSNPISNINTLFISKTPIYTPKSNVQIIPSANGIENNNINWWYGKVGDSLGDSLTEQRFYQLYTRYYLGLKRYSCHGIGGSKLSGSDVDSSRPSMWKDERINALSDDADFITILGGQNDGDVEIGEISKSNMDTNTYVGAYNTIIDKIYKKYNGKIQIILCTPFYVPSEGDNGERFIKLGKAVKEIGQLHGLPVADFGGLSGANKYVKDIYWGSDKTHPIEEFYRDKITPILVDTLNKVQPIDFNKCNYFNSNLNQG